MNRLTLILIVCVAAVAALLLFHDDDTVVDRTRVGEPFLPKLAANVNDASRLVVAKGDERVELVRKGDDWTVATSSGYPAKFEAVRGLLVSLARLVDAEPRTSSKERLGELTLADDGDEAGTRVTIEGKAAEPLADIVLGKMRWQPSQAIYLRRANEDQAYLVEGSPRAQTTSTTWLDTSLVALPAADVARVSSTGDFDVELGRDDTGAIVLDTALPEGRTLETPSPFSALFGALARLDFADVEPAENVAGDPQRTLTFSTSDGGSVQLQLFPEGAKTWARLAATASTPPPVLGPVPENTEAPTPKLAADQVEEWNTAWTPWAFELPSYRTKALLATWEDWLAPLPEPEAPVAGE